MDDSNNREIAYELFPHERLPLLRVYKDGHVERHLGTGTVPTTTTSDDPNSTVLSKDITIIIPEHNHNITARLFLPKLAATTEPTKKLPLLVYFHGGGFCVSSPFNSTYHNYLVTLVSKADVVAVSVNYRKAPEHPIPAAYEDSWAALKWALAHCNGNGPEVWLNEHADFERVFLSGESAGANIVHNLAIGFGPQLRLNVGLLGIALVHPYFWGSDPIGSEADDMDDKALADLFWPFICPSNPNHDDPRVNPMAEGAPSLAGLGCKRVLVCVAGKDVLRDRGRLYYEELGRSGWMGRVEIVKTEGEGHGFHLHNLECEKAKDLITRLAAFFNSDTSP